MLWIAATCSAQNIDVISESGLVSIEWDSILGIAYRLQDNGTLTSSWNNTNGDSWVYGLGQKISGSVYAFDQSGSGAPAIPNPPSSVHAFAITEYSTQGKLLISWQGDNGGQALLSRSALPETLPPVLTLQIDDSLGGFYSLTFMLTNVMWQDAFLDDYTLSETNLSGDQALELEKLTDAYPEIQDALGTGTQTSGVSVAGDQHFFRLESMLPDSDGDGVSNADEIALSMDPFHPDSDRDGFIDIDEIRFGSDPSNPSSTPIGSPGTQARYQEATITLDGDPSQMIGTASLAGKSWVVIKMDGLSTRTLNLTRGVEYSFRLSVTEDVVSTIVVEPSITDDYWRWWAEFGWGTAASGSYFPVPAIITLLPFDIVTDINGDKFLDYEQDISSAFTPFRFWRNNDYDASDATDFVEPIPAPVGDSSDNKITTKRDLENFARIWVNLGNRLDDFKSGRLALGFKWIDPIGNPQLKIYPHKQHDGFQGYLLTDFHADQQISGIYGNSLGTVTPGETLFLPQDFFETVHPNDLNVNFLFEGHSVGLGQLTVVVKLLGVEANGPREWIELMDVKRMYQRIKTDPDDPNAIAEAQTFQPPSPYVRPNLGFVPDTFGFPYERNPVAEKDYLIFVHGWKSNHEDFLRRSDTFFKRCWWAGFRGETISFFWPSFSEFNTFNASEYRARLAGTPLKSYVETLPGSYRKIIASHSLGAAVVASALEGGLTVDKYIPIQAALSAMCFDGSIIDFPNFETIDNLATNPSTQALGYMNRIPNNGIRIINYAQLIDNATGSPWDLNNSLFRPQIFAGTAYIFDGGASDLIYRSIWQPTITRLVTDTVESLSWAVRSRSKSLGVTPGAGRVVTDTRIMDSMGKISIGSDPHNAAFKDRTQNTNTFYLRLIEDVTE